MDPDTPRAERAERLAQQFADNLNRRVREKQQTKPARAVLVDPYTESLWARAVSHGVSAKELAAIAEQEAKELPDPDRRKMVFNGRHSASIHLLCGFCLELMLKSALLANGGTKEQAKDAGHNLRAIHEACQAVGFKPAIANLDFVIGGMNPGHMSNHFRYGDAPELGLPPLETTFAVLDALYETVGRMVYGSVER